MSIEQRSAARKILRSKAMLMIDGAEPVSARTLDIGQSGMAALVAEPVKTGLKGKVLFEMFYDGKLHLIEAKASVAHCIFSSVGFKLGLVFVSLDMPVMSAISKYMR